jgi:hypothetical protein
MTAIKAYDRQQPRITIDIKPLAVLWGRMAVNHEIVPGTLSRADGTTFENFANAFFSALLDADFVPLGGVHDGGADGYLVGVTEDKKGRFLQSSVKADHRPKISETLKALKKGGREVKQLIYATSKLIPFSH